MGLSIAGEFIAAERAYDWLASEQLDDGGWWASTLMARQPMSPANQLRRLLLQVLAPLFEDQHSSSDCFQLWSGRLILSCRCSRSTVMWPGLAIPRVKRWTMRS